MKDMKDPFDDKIRQSLEGFEMPYDPKAWAELQEQLPKPASSAASGNAGWKAFAIIGVVALSAVTYLYLQEPGNGETASVTTGVEQQQVTETNTFSERADQPSNTEQQSQESVNANTATSDQAVEDQTGQDPENNSSTTLQEPDPTAEVKNRNAQQSGDDRSEQQEQASELVNADRNAEPNVTLKASSRTACAGEALEFSAISLVKMKDLQFEMEDGTVLNGSRIRHAFTETGNHKVVLRANAEGTMVKRSVIVSVLPSPTADIQLERTLKGYMATPLFNLSTNAAAEEQVKWEFPDGRKHTSQKTTHLFRHAGIQTVKLQVTNDFGCSTENTKRLTTEKFTLMAPTGFSPNGDGNNDTFIPEALVHMNVPFTMSIQDPKTGQTVFTTKDVRDPWNGRVNNAGSVLPQGVYVWTVVLEKDILADKVFSGRITIK